RSCQAKASSGVTGSVNDCLNFADGMSVVCRWFRNQFAEKSGQRLVVGNKPLSPNVVWLPIKNPYGKSMAAKILQRHRQHWRFDIEVL
ncbi:MAG: hypothetical protein MK161_06085, partial [Pirellulales bacterium]|nr:hypothetical protein [Pirellulales bacterium]